MDIDWQSLLVPRTSLLELAIRGTVVYWGLFLLLRILVRRHVGTLSITDLLMIVLIADAAQNAMANEYRSLPEGAVLCATIIGWSYLLDWAAFRSDRVRRWVEPSPLPLVRDGRLLPRNMRQELITKDELMSQLREQGVRDIAEVKIALLEPDGQLSVTKSDDSSTQGPSRPKKSQGAF